MSNEFFLLFVSISLLNYLKNFNYLCNTNSCYRLLFNLIVIILLKLNSSSAILMKRFIFKLISVDSRNTFCREFDWHNKKNRPSPRDVSHPLLLPQQITFPGSSRGGDSSAESLESALRSAVDRDQLNRESSSFYELLLFLAFTPRCSAPGGKLGEGNREGNYNVPLPVSYSE